MSQINESAIKTPGVYVNEIPSFPPSVAQVATAVPAFIGYTQKAVNKLGQGLTLKPTRITSMLEYETYFGVADDETMTVTINGAIGSKDFKVITPLIPPKITYRMYYAMQLFYANGGGPCYIVSVGDYNATPALGADNSTGLQDGLAALEKEDEPTIIVYPDAVQLDTIDAYKDLMNETLIQCSKLGDRFALIDVYKTPDQEDKDNVADLRNKIASDKDLVMYGAVYHPWIETSINYNYQDSGIKIKHTGPGAEDNLDNKKLDELKNGIGDDPNKKFYNGIYNMIKAEIQKVYITMPPSSAMAGIYTRVDGSRGVWKAPANVSVMKVVKPEIIYNDGDQENFNIDTTAGKSINLIRTFIGKGPLVWGARTLAGNDAEWRYVSVRRFFNMVEESAKKATAQFVFEPNDANTWTKIRAMIENYLTILWRQGALAGAKPEHAFYVRIGLGQTMTAQDILDGKLIVEIGMAAVRPAEFIILRFMHKMQES